MVALPSAERLSWGPGPAAEVPEMSLNGGLISRTVCGLLHPLALIVVGRHDSDLGPGSEGSFNNSRLSDSDLPACASQNRW